MPRQADPTAKRNWKPWLILAALCAALGYSAYLRWFKPDPTAIADYQPANAEPFVLTVVHTNDSMGDLEPCG